MTVKELIAKLERFPPNRPVFVESAPWGCPYEVESVSDITVVEGRTKVKGVLVDHGVGM